MPNPKRPGDARSTEEILREMEELSKSIDETLADVTGPPANPAATASSSKGSGGGGAFKSLLNFFVTVDPATESARASVKPADPEVETTAAPAGAGPRVRDLVADEAPPSFEVPDAAASAAGLKEDLAQKAFEEIYTEAGVEETTCSVDELAKLLGNPSVVNQPMSVKVIAVNLALSAKGITPEVPIADAVRRDRALDAYQAMLAAHARATEGRNTTRIQELTREAEEYLKLKQAEMEALRGEIAEASRQSVDFALRREVEEKRLADLISPFLEGKPSPVSVGSQPSDKPPPA